MELHCPVCKNVVKRWNIIEPLEVDVHGKFFVSGVCGEDLIRVVKYIKNYVIEEGKEEGEFKK